MGMKKAFKDGFSIDESKLSLIMLTYGITFVEIIIMSWISKPMPSILGELVLAQLAAITGFNISKVVKGNSVSADILPTSDTSSNSQNIQG